ncbi:ferredoxin [Candidatus Geothermarchaeota archaeon ex4572_27]|nr:MAG: ferredoxin [Candidatus Geothermarchaeota archaeon ex4572_27]
MSADTVKVTIQPYGRRIEVKKGTDLLEAVRLAGIIIRSVCGGKGDCGKCKVIVRSGEVKHDYDPKSKLLTPDELSSGYVLACQARVLTDCEVFIPPETRVEAQKIQMDVLLPRISPDPAVKKVYIPSDEVVGGGLADAVGRRLGVPVEVEPEAAREAGELAIESPSGLTAVVNVHDGARAFAVEEGDTRTRAYGLAVDIGTTKIVVYLVDLVTGRILGSASDYNAQIAYGEDVVSRIAYAMDVRDGLKVLQRAVVETINRLASKLASEHGISTSEIYDVCVGGNTVMTYLFVGRDPSPLLETKVKVEIPREPFIERAADLGLEVNRGASVYCLPSAGRFLGGDAVGDILVSGMYRSSDVSLLIDIGTNVEVVLGCDAWLLSTTAAAGPAFEGWGVRYGMRAITGAIDSVKIDPETLKASYTVIGNVKPRGICGSGLIDLLSEMFRHGIIDTLGKINRKLSSPYIREGIDGYEYVVVPREEAGIDSDIVITEKDIANLIDAKSAACAAVAVLMKKMKLGVDDIGNVYICGAFGRYINPNSAMAIGLIPEFTRAKITYIGNGSVGGAYLTLVSRRYREDAVKVAKMITYYDLLKDADFMDEYLAGFVLPGKKELFPTWWEASRKKRRQLTS